MATREKPSFIQPLLGAHFSEYLEIPGAFLENFGRNDVPGHYYLGFHSRTWRVEVEDVDGKAYFKEGWKKFVLENGLKSGELLLFFYQGNSEFKVHIYGKDNCKKLPVKAAREESEGFKSKHVGSFKKSEGNNGFYVEKHVAGTSGTQKPRKQNHEVLIGRMCIDEDEDDDDDDDDDESEEEDSEEDDDDENTEDEDSFWTEGNHNDSDGTVDIGKFVAHKRARKLKSESGQPTFEVSMTATYIQGNHMQCSAEFARKHIDKRHSHVNLRVAETTWPVGIYYYSHTQVRFQAGWSKFAQRNQLVEGDVLVFVLTDKKNMIFDVEIFRWKEFVAECGNAGHATTSRMKVTRENSPLPPQFCMRKRSASSSATGGNFVARHKASSSSESFYRTT